MKRPPKDAGRARGSFYRSRLDAEYPAMMAKEADAYLRLRTILSGYYWKNVLAQGSTERDDFMPLAVRRRKLPFLQPLAGW
jgi:hypothetical protein